MADGFSRNSITIKVIHGATNLPDYATKTPDGKKRSYPGQSPDTPKRKSHSGTAKARLAAKAVTLGIKAVARMPPKQVYDLLLEARWGSWDTINCHHCGTISSGHYHLGKAMDYYHLPRIKCCACRKYFSLTSGTLFDGLRIGLDDLVIAALTFVNSANGQAATELRRHLGGHQYVTCFVLQHRFREGINLGFNVGFLVGALEIDGSHQAGWRANFMRGKTQVSQAMSKEKIEEVYEETIEKLGGGKIRPPSTEPEARTTGDRDGGNDVDYGKDWGPERRHVVSAKRRSGTRGMGAADSRVAVTFRENQVSIAAFMDLYMLRGECDLNVDKSRAYNNEMYRVVDFRSVEHNKQLVGPNGENNNLAESGNLRYDLLEKGTHRNIEAMYWDGYAAEAAWREDVRNMDNGAQLNFLLHLCMSVGRSRDWRNYTKGRHRQAEPLLPWLKEQLQDSQASPGTSAAAPATSPG